MAQKLGIKVVEKDCLVELEAILQLEPFDMTIFFRLLAEPIEELTAEYFKSASYQSEHNDNFSHSPDEIKNSLRLNKWLQTYKAIVKREGFSQQERHSKMNRVNPCFVLRNYLSQQAISTAEQGDFSKLNDLIDVLKQPYQHQVTHAEKYQKRPSWAKNSPGCSMLSCSS